MSDMKQLSIGFVGAGAIHFGGAEGPWDHATRIETIGHVRVVCIVDPLTKKAHDVLEKRKGNPQYGHIYKDCKIFPDIDAFLQAGIPIDAIFVGTPPCYRGCKKFDLELRLIKAGINLFVEKPVSASTPSELAEYSTIVGEACREKGVFVTIGYMFRYHAAVKKMKELIDEHGSPVMSYDARYFTAYSELDHPYWWDTTLSGGPIVEQATHVIDIARYLGGDILEDSVQAMTVMPNDEAGKISRINLICEKDVAEVNRLPRVTKAIWRFQSGGGLGSLTHAIALHGERYESTIEVVLDGLRLRLEEPYQDDCKLKVRSSKLTGNEDDECVFTFEGDDPYFTELDEFLRAVRSGDTSKLASPFSDSAKTYSLTCKIREISTQ